MCLWEGDADLDRQIVTMQAEVRPHLFQIASCRMSPLKEQQNTHPMRCCRTELLFGLPLYADVTPFLLTSSSQEKKLILEVKRAAKLGNQVGGPHLTHSHYQKRGCK